MVWYIMALDCVLIVVLNSTIFNTCYVHYFINMFTNYTLMRNKNQYNYGLSIYWQL